MEITEDFKYKSVIFTNRAPPPPTKKKQKWSYIVPIHSTVHVLHMTVQEPYKLAQECFPAVFAFVP